MKRADTVGIVGAGAFGTALGSVIARAGRRVILWTRDQEVATAIANQRKCPRLPEAELPEPLEVTTDPNRLASEARFLVMAVASTDVRDRAKELGNYVDGSHIIVHAIGALATPNNERVSEVMAQGLPTLKIGVIAGPALPGDLAVGEFSSMVVASVFDEVVAEARRLLNAPPALRVYGSKDLAGVELASALSGAYTVALGLCDGLGMGVGPRAVLVTRIVAEASRLAQAAGAEARTFAGLSGLGNMLVRSTEKSADYQLGKRVADGVLSADTQRTEGARAALAGAALAKSLKVRMPVLTGVAAVLAGKAEPREAASLVGDNVAVEE
ncbi:MAG TPA: 2-dehydropantoate 2-reductase N-terminal domain-containing protein [Kofleriaceae bacterium]|nr:2-dehydropantoate 2-reductase N-terminal domain-containing protein [Kofleriaceae bacterium]